MSGEPICGDGADAKYCPVFWAKSAECDELRDKLADETYDNAPAELLTARSQVDYFRELVREILREVELGTLGQHTPAATSRTLARTAEWRQRAGIENIGGSSLKERERESKAAATIVTAGTEYLAAELAERERA